MTGALIIAAGRRSGKDSFTPEQKIGTISAVERIALLFQRSGIRTIGVCGQTEQIKKLLPEQNLIYLPSTETCEMLHCIQSGVGFLQKTCDAILVCHTDVPMFSAATVQALLAQPGAICVPACQGRTGHPVLLRRSCFGKILEYRGDFGLRGAMEASGFQRQLVEVEDPGILSEYSEGGFLELLAGHDLSRLRLSSQFHIGRECEFYGPQVDHLLRLTRELGSLSEACRCCGISYSKGRKIIHTMEAQMHCTVMDTRQGGRGGGYSRLTAETQDMMGRYEAFCAEADTLLTELFRKHFPE